MPGNILISIGGLFFAILMTVVYFIKAKQTGIDNKLFKLCLITVIFISITELITIPVLYYLPNNVILGNFCARTNLILTEIWIMIMACYLMTLGRAYKVQSVIEYFEKSNVIQIIFFTYIALIGISMFFPLQNVSNSDGAYISGPALYFTYALAIISLVITIVLVAKSKTSLPEVKITPIIIGIIETVLSATIQLMFPMQLIITASFVFKMYLLYFMFENPDLYLIKELELAKKKADDSNKSKTDFLSNMSHEIRTPMNAILGFSEGILNDSKFNIENARKDITNIYSAGNNLLEIINNILDISKIETGEEKIELKEYSVSSIVLELKSIIEARITDNKIKFITDIDSKIPSKLLGDKTKIFQVLLNILSNSVKYTEVGQIKLTIRSEIVDNKCLLKFKISDTGYGIKKEDYDKLFEKFSRLEIATKKEIEGTGLGLVITKRLVTLMGGRVWFESEYGAGTTFYVEISQKIIDKNPIGDIHVENTIRDEHDYLDCSRFKALIVDDNKLNLKVAEKVLSNYKFKISTLLSGKECIDEIKQGKKYDIIFLDHMMPNMDGIEVLHILRKLDDFDIPPVVALTANAITGMKEMYLNEGFDDYLSKPINTSELDKLINKYFDEGAKKKNE
ncbi:MAG: ATP-binding protein [bacterium]|nr:ATP-binding protein [bacterium]